MSDMETHKGKIVPIYYSNTHEMSIEQYAALLCKLHGYEKKSYHESWVDCLSEEGRVAYFVSGQTIYLMEDKSLDSNGFVEFSRNKDGSYEYITSFYNGGTCLNEILNEIVNKEE